MPTVETRVVEEGAERRLVDSFNEYFEVLPALDAASREAVYRIRHEVYCRDLGWEPVREDGMETDAFDRHSVHLLLRRQGSGEPVGCTRLVFTDPLSPLAPLPFELACADVLDRRVVDPTALPREQVAEVSRLAVMRNYRQRRGESAVAAGMSEEDFQPRGPQSRFPFIPVSLYLAAAAVAHRLGRENVFVLTEPRLASHFSRIGFDIEPVGGPIEHRGIRVPSRLRTSKVIEGLRPMIRPLFEVVEASVARAYRLHG